MSTHTSLWPWLEDYRIEARRDAARAKAKKAKPRCTEVVELADEDDIPLSPRRGALGAAVISIGVTLGALALVWWRRRHERLAGEREVTEHVSGTLLAASPPARLVPIDLPQTTEAFEKLLDVARTWLKLVPQFEDHELAVLVWSPIWPGVPYPGQPRAGDHPSIGQAVEMVLRAITVARAEVRDRDTDTHAKVDTRDRDTPLIVRARPRQTASAPSSVPPSSLLALTRESPTPGYFYEVRDGDELLGDDGLAAIALRSAVIEAATDKRWPADKIEARAAKLAGKAEARTLYADLIRQSKWNAERTDPLRAGSLLWLPPLRRLGLLDRSRLRQVALDPSPWPDGSSKLEPHLGDSDPCPSQWTSGDDDYGRGITYAPFHRFAHSA